MTLDNATITEIIFTKNLYVTSTGMNVTTNIFVNL